MVLAASRPVQIRSRRGAYLLASPLGKEAGIDMFDYPQASRECAAIDRWQATGEMVFIELGDEPAGHLGATLHGILSMLKVTAEAYVEVE